MSITSVCRHSDSRSEDTRYTNGGPSAEEQSEPKGGPGNCNASTYQGTSKQTTSN